MIVGVTAVLLGGSVGWAEPIHLGDLLKDREPERAEAEAFQRELDAVRQWVEQADREEREHWRRVLDGYNLAVKWFLAEQEVRRQEQLENDRQEAARQRQEALDLQREQLDLQRRQWEDAREEREREQRLRFERDVAAEEAARQRDAQLLVQYEHLKLLREQLRLQREQMEGPLWHLPPAPRPPVHCRSTRVAPGLITTDCD